MKNWTRTSLILLAFSIGACESQTPTAPTSLGPAAAAVSSGSVASGTSASGTLGVKGGGKGKDDKVAFDVDTTLGVGEGVNGGDFCTIPANAWFSIEPHGFTSKNTLFTKWPPGAVKVTTTGGPGDDVMLNGQSTSVGTDNKGQIVAVRLFGGSGGVRHRTGTLAIIGAPLNPSPKGFTIHVHQAAADVFPTIAKGNKTGAFVGTICVGDLVFEPTS